MLMSVDTQFHMEEFYECIDCGTSCVVNSYIVGRAVQSEMELYLCVGCSGGCVWICFTHLYV